MIIILKNKFEGWENLAKKIEDFISRKPGTRGAFISNSDTYRKFIEREGDFLEALCNNRWS